MRWLAILFGLALLASLGLPQQRERRQAPAAPKAPLEPDEEEPTKPAEYTFNPLQAEREVKIGDFYLKKKNYRAAAGRYGEATKWNPQADEAFYKWGQALTQLGRRLEAITAFEKYLEAAPTGAHAAEVKKRIAELKGKTAKPDAAARTPAP
jgi:tetratricopeptide (TPR) repeat protein